MDVLRFRRLVADAGESPELLRQALGLWRGPTLAGVDSRWLNGMRESLERERLAAVLELNEVRLRLGQHAALAVELAGHVTAAPGDERLAGQLMLALYRCGQAPEALRVFERTRAYLAEELGADPGPALRRLHEQVLREDAGLNLATTAVGGQFPGVVPQELPADVAAFTGREAELRALDELLLGDGASTAAVISAVSGTAGVGKTALAVHWAHHAAVHFPDGQLHVNLRGYDPAQPVSAADALARFLSSLGVPGPEIPAEEEQRAARYRSLLAGRRMLVVLDNAATVEQVRPLLPGHPGCRVLVTSRDSLAGLVARDGARRLDLDLLPLAEAVALLAELIGQRAKAESEAVTELAEQCARLPLALRVAAELAIARSDVSLSDLVAELADEQRRLEMLSSDGDPRTAVRAVFSWSYEHLDEQAARAFRLAALHPGPDFEAYAVAALTDSTLAPVRRVLDTLTRAHLVQPAPAGRYTMHDLLRAYASDAVVELDGEQESRAALTRLFDHYLFVAAAAMDTLHPAERHRRPRVASSSAPAPPVTDPEIALGWLEGERASLVAVAVHAADNGWPRHATQLSGTLFRYFYERGHTAEEAAIHAAAQRAARATGDMAGEAAALNARGVLARFLGRYEEAVGYHQQALALSRKALDRAGQASALQNLGNIEMDQGSYSEAARHNREAMDLFCEAADRDGQARSLNSLGVICRCLGQYDQAVGFYRRALTLFRETMYEVGEAGVLTNLGVIYDRVGQYEQAAAHHNRALALFRRLGNRAGEAIALNNLGTADYGLGRYSRARDWHLQALDICTQIGDLVRIVECHNDLGMALLADRQLGEAEGEYAVALSLASQMRRKQEEARAHDGLGRCCHARGDRDCAREHWQRALELFTWLGAPEVSQVRARLDELMQAGAEGGAGA